MFDVVLSILGIIVSIVLYLIGYKQTVGAKKERIHTANKEVEKILLRRVVNENYHMSIEDISRIAIVKARDFKVKSEDLYSEEQVLNSLFTRVMESDFLNQEQREEILTRVYPIIDIYSYVKESEYHPNNLKENIFSSKTFSVFLSGMIALMASIAGLFSVIPVLEYSHLSVGPLVFIITISGSLLAITFISISRRFRGTQQEIPSSKNNRAIQAEKFENLIGKVLSKKNIHFQTSKWYDFLINYKGKKIIIEGKIWRGNIPRIVIEKSINRVQKAMKNEGAEEGIIVTYAPVRIPERYLSENLKVLTIHEFIEYL